MSRMLHSHQKRSYKRQEATRSAVLARDLSPAIQKSRKRNSNPTQDTCTTVANCSTAQNRTPLHMQGLGTSYHRRYGTPSAYCILATYSTQLKSKLPAFKVTSRKQRCFSGIFFSARVGGDSPQMLFLDLLVSRLETLKVRQIGAPRLARERRVCRRN